MKLHRFIGNLELKIGDLKIDDKQLLNQWRNVLKLKVEEKIILCDGKMNEGTAKIKEYGKNFVVVQILETNFNKNEPERQVILYCAILKKENFEWVVQKATEIGIKEIAPIITERTIKLDIRKDRLEKIIKESAEQSGRGIVPVLHEPIYFDKAITATTKQIDSKSKFINILFDLSGESFENCKPIRPTGGLKIEHSSFGIWVGPEGGWSPQELELALKSGFKIVNLGKLTLRAETAVIIGSYLAIHSLYLLEL